MFTFILWVFLAIFSLPLAIGVLIIYPFIWLILLPFRILGFAIGTILDILKEIILLPAKFLRSI